MNSLDLSPEVCESAFAARTRRYLLQAAMVAQTWYDADGNWLLASEPPMLRERCWLSSALYDQGKAALADAIILRGSAYLTHMGDKSASPFDIFHSNFACVLLRKHRQQMSAAASQKLEQLARSGLEFQPGNRRPDYQFHGYNDNMPCEATSGLIVGGELLGCPEAVEHGIWNLTQFRALLTRRGINSEWNSPTYSATSIRAISEIAEHACNPQARELALKIEERLWIDLAARFHPETGVLAGPYSRAYTADTLAHLSSVAAMLWFVLGDVVNPSPMDLFEHSRGLVLHHFGDLPFNISQFCIFADGCYHVPTRALEMFAKKTYPFHAVATAEQGDGSPEHPAYPTRLETYLERDFTVGTSTILGGGQTHPYFATYKRAAHVKSFADVGTVFNKITINDEVPGTIKSSVDKNGRSYANSGEDNLLRSHGDELTLQSGPSVLVLTQPKLSLGGSESTKAQALTRLDEMVIFPAHFGGAEEIRIGNRACESWTGNAAHGEWIGCRRGCLLIAIRPLVYAPELGAVGTSLEKINQYEVLRSTFYQGAARTFTRHELGNIFGGFIVEHASVDDYPSLSAFMEELAPSRFTDFYWTTRRIRYRRPVGRVRPALEFEVSWSPGSPTRRYAMINGFSVSQDQETRVSIDGMNDGDFPFFGDSWTSAPSYFPWPSLEATWAPGHTVKGFIGDREEQNA